MKAGPLMVLVACLSTAPPRRSCVESLPKEAGLSSLPDRSRWVDRRTRACEKD